MVGRLLTYMACVPEIGMLSQRVRIVRSFLELVFDYEALNETGSDELIQLTGRTAIEIGLSVRPCARPESQQIATSHKPTERDDSHASGPIYPHMGPGRAHRWRGAG